MLGRFKAASVGVAILAAIICLASVGAASAAETNAVVSVASVPKAADTKASDPKAKEVSKPVQKTKADPKAKADPAQKVSGAELYAVNCNRCHPERDPSEFTAAQWETMMIYMRVRANLPASHARAITRYLQDQAGQ